MDLSFEDYLQLQDMSAEEASALVDIDEHDQDNNMNTIDQSHSSSALTEDDLFPDEQNSTDYPNENSQAASNLQLEASLSPTTKNPSTRGPFSPFSPLTRAHTQRRESAVSWQSQGDDLSLIPCRKVSVVVRVKIPKERTRLCLFPLVPETPSSTLLSPTSATIQAACDTNDICVVNPCAFGKFIPAEVTMDTARLVANVANIESEDWARRYRFDQVLWNNVLDDTTDLRQLALSMGNDAVLHHRNSVCLGVGGSHSGRTETMFGNDSSSEVPSSYGLLGLTVAAVLEQLSEHAVCTLSVLEIVDEEILRDLLEHDPVETQSRLKIRHIDSKGAVVQNLSDVPLDSVAGLDHLMRKAFHSNAAQKVRKREGSRGHVIATLKVWQNGVQFDLGNLARCSTVVLADLASGEEGDARNTRRMASYRKSISGLRGVLRSLLQQEHDEAAAASYRECTLTRVLQRPLLGSQTVVMATVSACTDSYERTLHTLNYVNRLLIRPGKTARSPFSPADNPRSPEEINSSTPALFDQFADSEALLESMLSDPRQRLAKVLRPRFLSLTTPIKLELSDSEAEGYEPYDYMNIDPGAINEMHSLESPSRRELDSSSHQVTKAEHIDEDEIAKPNTDESQHIGNGEQRAKAGNARAIRVSHAKHKSTIELNEIDKDKSHRVSGVWLPNQSTESLVDTDPMQFKTVVSLSEESSTLPAEQKEEVIKSAPQHNPNEVDEWIASFEAENNADTEDVVQTGPASGRRTLSSVDLLSEDDHESDRESTNRSDAIELDDTSISKLEEAVIEMVNELNEIASSGTEDEELSGIEDEMMDVNGFTPKTDWPEDDDKSTLSLTSLHQDMGNTTDGEPQRERYTDAFDLLNDSLAPMALSDTSGEVHEAAMVETNSSAALRPRGRSHPSSSKQEQMTVQHRAIPSNVDSRRKNSSLHTPTLAHVALNRTGVLLCSDECLGEIHVLEDAVDQIKRVHNGLWETSTLSLDRLRQAQMMQQRVIEEAVAARRASEAETDKLRKELMRQSKEGDDASRAFEEKLMEMKSRLDKALTDRSDIETIAEEAIAAQDRLERDVSLMKKSLETQQEKTESAMAKYSQVVESRNELLIKLELATNSLTELQSKYNDCGVVMADLEATVDRLVIEAEELMEAKDRLEREFELSKEENLALGEENERLVIELRDYQAHFQEAEDMRTAHNEQLQAEHLALQSELEMWQCRCREVEASRERAAQKYIEERAALLDELSDVNKRLVESNAEISAIDEANENLVKHQNEDIDRLTSEFHALQLEREHDRKALSDTERAFSKLRSDAKEKLKHLVKQKQAASMTIEKLKKDNAAHAESNRHLRNRIERAERGRDSLQQRVTGLEERLEVEQLARREAEDRIQKLESRPATTESEIQMDCAKPSRRRNPHQGENTEAPEIQMDQAKTSRRWDPHQEQYTEAELALLKEIEAEKLSKDYRDGGFENDQAPLSAALREGSRKWQRADFGMFRRHLDAKYGNPDTPDFVPVETYHAECARRIQAEDLVATMAAHAKEGLEKRNKEIMSLKLRLSSEVDEKESEILSLRTQLHALRRKSLS